LLIVAHAHLISRQWRGEGCCCPLRRLQPTLSVRESLWWNDLKAAIQIAYQALPASITNNPAAAAVETAATNEVSVLAAKASSASGVSQ
jgi:hypothetical protein